MNVKDIQRIAVVGAGLMGHGIAQEFALAGYEVTLQSLPEDTLDKAMRDIRANLGRLVELGAVTPAQAEAVPARIRTSPDLGAMVEDADVVIEAVYEDLTLKRRIFVELDRLCPPHTILASNTSTFMPGSLVDSVQRRDKLLVAHYFNPPYLVPLVELVRSQHTSEETVTTMFDLLTKIGKQPVIVQKEVPGFIANRLQVALLREALMLVDEGVARPQDVDTVIKSSIGRRWAVAGVFEVSEAAGWDILSAVASELLPHINSSTELSSLVKGLVERGDLGLKTGKGLYDWPPDSAEALRQRIAQALVEIDKWG
jgi:3-hydroxybutyryl-CoA dehydrogenase